jgi:sugar phosphate isomerase/epimerase
MNQRIFIHLPYAELNGRLDILAREKLYPEIYLPAHVLEETPPSALGQLALALQEKELCCTIHGPFLDLNAGSRDESIRKVTLDRYGQAFAAARLLKPRQMVLHAGYDRWHYGNSDDEEKWLQASLRTWDWALDETHDMGLILALENVFEHRPQILANLLCGMDSDRLRFCFDIGHHNIFSDTPMKEWVDELATFLAEVHLHDNLGEDDDHLAIGQGKIDFPSFFERLRENGARPQLTIEAFDEGKVRLSLQALKGYYGKEEKS